MSSLFESLDLLNTIYLVLVGIGFIYAILILLGQGVGDIDFLDVDFDSGDVPSFDHGEVGLTSISPMSIASFVTAFGAFGLTSSLGFGVSSGVSLVYAVIGGVLVGGVAQALFIYVFSPQTSSLRTQQDVVGSVAEVITPIPDGGVGQIALVAKGMRATYSARTQSGLTFKQGDLVRVSEFVGSIAFVEPR